MTIHQFIHISLVSAFLLTSTVKAQVTNPVCYVCGGDPTATIGNPDVLIDIPPEYNAPAPQATCQQIYQAGLDNLISAEVCDGIELLVDAQIMCGCSNVVTNPVCYVCGGDPTAMIGNPDVLIDIPPEYNAPAPQATCQQIYQAGLDNLISAEACDGIELLVDAQILCGCSNVVAPNPGLAPAPTAIAAPVSVPTELPVPVEVPPSVVDPAETEPPADIPMPNETVPFLPTPLEKNPPVTTTPNPVNGETNTPVDCEGKGKGKEVSSIRGKGKGGMMMMGKKCKKLKEPKTPKVDKGMEGKGKGKGERLRLQCKHVT